MKVPRLREQASEQGGMILEAAGEDVNHVTFPLHFADDAKQARVQQLAALGFDQARPDDHVDGAGLVLEGDEDDARRGSRSLAHGDEAARTHGLTVFAGGQLRGTEQAPSHELPA